MKNQPTKKGLYWCKLDKEYNFFNCIAEVDGEAPYLYIEQVWVINKERIEKNIKYFDIVKWGDKIEQKK